MDESLIISFGSKFQALMTLGKNEYAYVLKCVGIWKNLFGSLNISRLYFILYGKISWCCNRRVSNVSQPSLLKCVRLAQLCDGRHVLRIGRHFCVFFQSVDIILGMWVPGYSSMYSNVGLIHSVTTL